MTDQVEQDVELDEDETEIEEAHDPKNAELQSVKATAQAADAGKGQTPLRRGDKRNSEPSNLKTRAGLMNAVFQGMSQMSKENLQGLLTKMKEDVDGGDDEAAVVAESEYDFSDDLNALVAEEATLSEGFKDKAAVIFEAAIKSKISSEIDRLEEQYKTELDEEITRTKEELVEKVDGYLNYVVENWMEENKLAIQAGLRTEIAEGFMDKLKGLFEESYIEVPESKVDLVDGLVEQVEELETSLNDQTGKFIEMQEELEQYKRYEVIREHAFGLADTEIEKLAQLSEDIDFEDEETFSAKVKTIKESYFKKSTATAQSEDWTDDADETADGDISDSMAMYLQALRKS